MALSNSVIGQLGNEIILPTTFGGPGATPPTRYIPLIDAVSDAGVSLTAVATGGAMGISRTAGTSLVLVGAATSASAVTSKALFVISVPDTYSTGSTISLIINCNYTGAGTVTAASTTLSPVAYTEVNGVETALTVTPASQQIPATATNLTFTIPADGYVPASVLGIELVMLVTTSAGAATGQINSIAILA